jgi:hypothetical protein
MKVLRQPNACKAAEFDMTASEPAHITAVAFNHHRQKP